MISNIFFPYFVTELNTIFRIILILIIWDHRVKSRETEISLENLRNLC